MNKRDIYNKKNMIYHKKFINLNKRYNNSVETNERRHKYVLYNPNNNKYFNNSLFSIVSNKNKKRVINNNNSTSLKTNNNKRSIKNLKSITIRKNNFFSQEKPKNFCKLIRFSIPTKSKNSGNKNKSVGNNNNSNNNNKLIKNENSKNLNDLNALALIEKINKIPTLVCCKCSIEKIKEIIIKIFLNNDKNNGIITVNKKFPNVIIKCNIINKNIISCFEFNVSILNDANNYIMIKPSLTKGDRITFFELFEKAKKELLK
jgi:hypothetical protein